MRNFIDFKKIHNRIGVYMNNILVREISTKEFDELYKNLEDFKSNNPVLFEKKYEYITVDTINNAKYGNNASIGIDFSDNLKSINIRPIYFYKKDKTYLFYDFIYKKQLDNSKPNEYGINNYSIDKKEAVSISIEYHDQLNIKRGYITNAYLRGLFDDEVKNILKNIENLNIYLNGILIDNFEFWNENINKEYDSLLSSAT